MASASYCSGEGRCRQGAGALAAMRAEFARPLREPAAELARSIALLVGLAVFLGCASREAAKALAFFLGL